jgi:hypothetical protein
MGADGRHSPFLQGPGDEQRAHRCFHAGAMFAPDLIETEQLFHPFEYEFDVIVTSSKIRMVRQSRVFILQRTRNALS